MEKGVDETTVWKYYNEMEKDVAAYINDDSADITRSPFKKNILDDLEKVFVDYDVDKDYGSEITFFGCDLIACNFIVELFKDTFDIYIRTINTGVQEHYLNKNTADPDLIQYMHRTLISIEKLTDSMSKKLKTKGVMDKEIEEFLNKEMESEIKNRGRYLDEKEREEIEKERERRSDELRRTLEYNSRQTLNSVRLFSNTFSVYLTHMYSFMKYKPENYDAADFDDDVEANMKMYMVDKRKQE